MNHTLLDHLENLQKTIEESALSHADSYSILLSKKQELAESLQFLTEHLKDHHLFAHSQEKQAPPKERFMREHAQEVIENVRKKLLEFLQEAQDALHTDKEDFLVPKIKNIISSLKHRFLSNMHHQLARKERLSVDFTKALQIFLTKNEDMFPPLLQSIITRLHDRDHIDYILPIDGKSKILLYLPESVEQQKEMASPLLAQELLRNIQLIFLDQYIINQLLTLFSSLTLKSSKHDLPKAFLSFIIGYGIDTLINTTKEKYLFASLTDPLIAEKYQEEAQALAQELHDLLNDPKSYIAAFKNQHKISTHQQPTLESTHPQPLRVQRSYPSESPKISADSREQTKNFRTKKTEQ